MMRHDFVRALCGLFCLVIFLCACGKDGATTAAVPEVNVLRLEPRDLALVVDFAGQAKGAFDAEVIARVQGALLAIHFKEGQLVREGDLLYEIDPRPFETELAESKVKLANAGLRLNKAESDLTRLRPLGQVQAVSKPELDAAITAVRVAQTELEAAQARVPAAQSELSYTRIAAPVSGLIGRTRAGLGEIVGSAPGGSVLNTVSNPDNIRVRFTVTAKDYEIFAGLQQRLKGSGQAQGLRELELVLENNVVHPHRGQIVSADTRIDPATGVLSAEAVFPNPAQAISPGQPVRVRAVSEILRGALVLPKHALTDIQGTMQVLVVGPDNVLSLRSVKTGAEIGGRVVASEGLSAGELVVAEAAGKLRSGMTIKPGLLSLGGVTATAF